MKNLLLSALLIVSAQALAQSDGCSSATLLSVTANCSSPVSGTTLGATQTIAGCSGNADDDVWYQFTATNTAHQITVIPIAGFDPVVQLFSGTCSTLTSLVCKDNGGSGVTEIINYNGLTPGSTYTVRIYHYGAGSGTGNFTICVTNPPPTPSNDECISATPLNVNGSCSYTNATTDGASQSLTGCSGTADDDVWFSFVATNSLQNIQVNPIDAIDLVFQVYSGSCGALNSLICIDNTFTGDVEQSDIVGLVPGQTYYIRVYDYYQGNTGDFQICITGTPTPTPTNDDPCSAIQLPAVTATCQFSQFTTVGASATMSAPTPSTCAGGSGAAIGGFSASSSDVWFAITVPASGNVDVTAQPNGGAGSITDGVMALYSGTCSSLTQIACSDDNNYPGSTNDLLPFLSVNGLTPGSTVYLRYWGFGSSTGTFGICVSTATNDDCANALYICDINGYSASTSASYTPDRPDNMRGNNEDINGNNLVDGFDSGGIFGQAGPWGTGSANFDVVIDNNSWIKFTAANTTATLDVDVYDCWTGNGIQMQIFEGTNCTNFIPVSNFEESAIGFTITAINLTIGNDYYLMVDGFAGDICNYTITANSGVQFPDIADVNPICEGGTVTLNAPPGATSYEWQHDGSATPSVTVSPSTTQTYYCEVTGLCDYKQMLDVVVTVNPNPNVNITNGATTSICQGASATLTATGATNYTWSTGGSGASINVSPTTNTQYTVTGIDANGCSNNDVITVQVNSLPTLAANPNATDADCGGSNGALLGATASGNGPFSYSWSNGASTIGSTANLNNVPAGNYYLTVTDANTCNDQFGPFNISNPGAPPAPSLTIDDNDPCLGASSVLTASSAASSPVYNWTGPNGFTATGTTVNLTNVTSLESGNYCVSVTSAGCTGPSSCQTITVLNDPLIAVTAAGNDSTICLFNDINLSASGADSYTWTGPNNYSGSGSTINIPSAQQANSGYYAVTGIDANGCSATDSILISVLQLPIVDLAADHANNIYCNGYIANLTASGAMSYTWTGPSGFTSSNSSVTLISLDAGDQGYYYVTGTDSEGCANSDSIFLTIITNVPAFAPSDTMICPGETLILYGSGGQTYNWNGPAGYYSELQNPTVTTDASFENSGIYYLTVTDANGCLGYDSTLVEVTNNGDCLFIPNLTTPDKDGHNDLWVIEGLDKFENAEVEIYNRWGNMVYYSSPYNNDWDGTVNQPGVIDGEGKVPVGTYFYIIKLNEGDKPPFKGYVEVQY